MNYSPCAPAEARRWIFLIFRREIWKFSGKFGGNFVGFFLTHRTKAQKIRGKFRSIFHKKIRRLKKIVRAKFTLRTSHLDELLRNYCATIASPPATPFTPTPIPLLGPTITEPSREVPENRKNFKCPKHFCDLCLGSWLPGTDPISGLQPEFEK